MLYYNIYFTYCLLLYFSYIYLLYIYHSASVDAMIAAVSSILDSPGCSRKVDVTSAITLVHGIANAAGSATGGIEMDVASSALDSISKLLESSHIENTTTKQLHMAFPFVIFIFVGLFAPTPHPRRQSRFPSGGKNIEKTSVSICFVLCF